MSLFVISGGFSVSLETRHFKKNQLNANRAAKKGKMIRHYERTETYGGDVGDFLVHNCYSSLAALIHIPVRNRPLSQAVVDSWRLQVLYCTNYLNINIKKTFAEYLIIKTKTWPQPLCCTLFWKRASLYLSIAECKHHPRCWSTDLKDTYDSSPRRCCPSSRRHRRTSRWSVYTFCCCTETVHPHTRPWLEWGGET